MRHTISTFFIIALLANPLMLFADPEDELPVDWALQTILENAYKAESICSGDAFDTIAEKQGLTEEECHSRVDTFREDCPKRIAKDFPESVPEERISEILDAMAGCLFSVVYAIDPDADDVKK